MNFSRIESIIPFISFPVGIIAFTIWIIEFNIKSHQIIHNPLSQLMLFAAFMTTICLLLLSFRAIIQTMSKQNNKR